MSLRGDNTVIIINYQILMNYCAVKASESLKKSYEFAKEFW